MDLPEGTVLGRKKGTDVREGDIVKKLQEELSKLGYDLGDEAPGKKDHGKYGDKTEKTVEDFQKKKGLGVDGRVGRGETAPAINKVVAGAALAAILAALQEALKRLNETQLKLAEEYRKVAEEHIKKSGDAKTPEEKSKELDKAKEALDKASEILRKKKEEHAAAPQAPEKPPAEMTREEFIAAIAAAAEVTKHCVPVSVTIAQAILESNWGKSDLARNANNLFGIKGKGPAGSYKGYRKYNRWKESVDDHGKVLCGDRYKRAREHLDDPDRYAKEKQKAGYAEDPDYAKKLKKVMRDHDLKKYDK